jgi:2-polyprenyl-3-methyl-5-hydroxy-6-metoxy-1,4-benzoquinol methylase
MNYIYNKNDVKVYNNQMGLYKTQRQLGFIQRFLEKEPLRILDVGGGNGRLALPLAAMGHKVTVVDISDEALGMLRAEGGPDIECVQSDLMALEGPRDFDVVLTVDCVKYVTHALLKDVFAKVHQLLANDGFWVFSDINAGSWRNHLRDWSGRRGTGYNIANASGYREAVSAAGFKISDISGYCWMPLLFNSNSSLVPLFSRIEAALALNKWISQSPWLLIAARKNR